MKEDDYMNNKCIAFLDILGFSDCIVKNKNAAYAANILFTTKHVLKTKIIDSKKHYEDNDDIEKLVLRDAVTSFERMIPISDSIFITSNDPNVFIKQISSFLLECFSNDAENYSYYTKDNNGDVIKKGFGSDWDSIYTKDKWYPILFRGGISYGEVLYEDIISIYDSNPIITPNIVGKSVVAAVSLEENEGKGNGPKLFIDDAFYEQLNDENKLFVKTEPNGTKHVLWPGFKYSSIYDLKNEYDKFEKILQYSIFLLKMYEKESFKNKYIDFVKIVIDSFVCFCNKEYHNQIDLVKNKIRDYIKEQDIDLVMFDLI